MTLNLIKTTYSSLDSTARCVLSLLNEPFFFVRMQNTLYMNKRMKGIRNLTAAVETMWKYDYIENDEIMEEIDAAYDTIKNTAGKKAAEQALNAWREMARESREAMAKAEALEWITTVYEKMTDADWDEIYAAGYSYDFVNEGLWRAFSKLHSDNPDYPGYRDWSGNARKAAFVYGYQLGARQQRRDTPFGHLSGCTPVNTSDK